jgi:hypothetical protein
MASREDVEIRLKHIQARLDELKSLLRPILGNPIQVTLADVEPFGTAQVQVALAYTMQTLFYSTKTSLLRILNVRSLHEYERNVRC